MGARGFYRAQEGHSVQVLPPVNASGGKTGQAFSLKNHEHASIVILQGSVAGGAAGLTNIKVNACTDASGANPVAVPFDVFKCETNYSSANGDVLGARTAVTAAGFTPAGTSNIMYVLELDTAQVEAVAGFDHNYLQVVITDASPVTTTALVSVEALLSGGRYKQDQSETVIA